MSLTKKKLNKFNFRERQSVKNNLFSKILFPLSHPSSDVYFDPKFLLCSINLSQSSLKIKSWNKCAQNMVLKKTIFLFFSLDWVFSKVIFLVVVFDNQMNFHSPNFWMSFDPNTQTKKAGDFQIFTSKNLGFSQWIWKEKDIFKMIQLFCMRVLTFHSSNLHIT